MTKGICRFCECTWFNACPQGTDPITEEPIEGCYWVDGGETLCSACEEVERAWSALTNVTQDPAMRQPFFWGFMVGSCDERSDGRPREAFTGRPLEYFRLGVFAGEQELARA